jgi:hypothetical protein
VPWFASPAIESPASIATAIGRNSVSSALSPANATKNPFPAIWLKKSGP